MVCVLGRIVGDVLESRTCQERIHIDLRRGVVVHVEGKSFVRRSCTRRFERGLNKIPKLDRDRTALNFPGFELLSKKNTIYQVAQLFVAAIQRIKQRKVLSLRMAANFVCTEHSR